MSNMMVMSDFRLEVKWKDGHFVHSQWKICNITIIYGQIAASYCKLGSRITMVTLNFKLEVEIWQFRAFATKIMQYNAY